MMGKHGPTTKLWPTVIGLIAAALAVSAFFLLVFGYPNWKP
jgi:hypothetical protein